MSQFIYKLNIVFYTNVYVIMYILVLHYSPQP